ncbi:MAG: bifunctional riboflavin kinase/FAD synthetase [Pseudomonadota bacterium]|nr:bifunctional riboflavin kinase/FAD synthetase [Pseudomonadota bacterium]MED5554920.1 bifunctional riboflavin kinase/FAD synthetase [Pseudomonadota bacterium]
MEIIRGLHNITARHKGCVLSIGTFDGLHHGHQMLLSHLKAKSEELNYPNLLVTFEPQPREYFQGAVVPARLTRFREKVTILRGLALDRLLCIPFNERTRIIPAKDVIEGLLVNTLDVQYLVVGDDFQFGEGARGNYEMLKEAGDRFGFGVSHMGTLKFEHGRISSSRIRDALSLGDFDLAEKLLGRPYFIMGRVVYGRQLGRQLGVPTANIRLQRYRAALEGVFAVTVMGLDQQYEGIANIGVRPTVDGKEPLLEVHIFDFDEEIYGRLLTVTFLNKVRDERTFDGLDSLKNQIEQDISETREWFAKRRLERDPDMVV